LARRTFEVIDVVEILQHWHAGRPKTVVAASLNVDVKTVRKYVAPAEAAGITPGDRPPPGRAEWAGLVQGWFPELVDAQARSKSFGEIDRFRAGIGERLETNTVTTVWQRLRDESGLQASLTSFRRYVWREFPDKIDESKVTVLRPDVPAGEEVQIDYGFLGNWVDPATERVRRVWAFVMILACSRFMFVRPVLRMDQTSWVAAHVAGFEFFGGVPRRLVTDNLKTGVIKADLYDPKLNRAYAEMAEHYGVLIDPARAAKPKDKPRVERQMPYIRDSFWRGRAWVAETDMQTGAVSWCRDVAGARTHRSLEGAAPARVFEAVELPALTPLPRAPFVLASWSSPKVGPDCHVKVGKALYSIPWRLIGSRVDARSTARTVEFYLGAQLVKTHPRIEKGRQTDWDDYPPEKVAFFMRTPTWCRKKAAEIGPNVSDLVADLLSGGALHHLRAAQGVIGLAEKHGEARLDAACARAVTVGDPSYRTVKGILAAGTEAEPTVASLPPAAPAHLHGPAGLLAHLDDVEAAG
jgi:transposase